MPLGLAVVTEGVAAAGPLARYPRARSAAGGDHSVRAVWSRAPPSVGIGCQDASQHEELVELQQVVVVAYQHLNVWNQQFGMLLTSGCQKHHNLYSSITYR